jgi:hypothetical protein
VFNVRGIQTLKWSDFWQKVHARNWTIALHLKIGIVWQEIQQLNQVYMPGYLGLRAVSYISSQSGDWTADIKAVPCILDLQNSWTALSIANQRK